MLFISSFLKSCFPLFFCFLLQRFLHTTLAPISPFLCLNAEKQHKLLSLRHSLKYTLCSPQMCVLLLRIFISSGWQHHCWVHVCPLARNCLFCYCNCQLHGGEVRAFWSLLCLLCLENYRGKTLRQSVLIYAIFFLSHFITAPWLWLPISKNFF